MAQQQQKTNDTNPLQLPISDRDLAACRRCHRILTTQQFVREGCSNCGEGPLRGEDLHQNTTQQFYGSIGIVDSRRSWIARLIGCEGAPSGVYAARVAAENADDGASVRTD